MTRKELRALLNLLVFKLCKVEEAIYAVANNYTGQSQQDELLNLLVDLDRLITTLKSYSNYFAPDIYLDFSPDNVETEVVMKSVEEAKALLKFWSGWPYNQEVR